MQKTKKVRLGLNHHAVFKKNLCCISYLTGKISHFGEMREKQVRLLLAKIENISSCLVEFKTVPADKIRLLPPKGRKHSTKCLKSI